MSPANSLPGVQKPADHGTRRRDLAGRKAAAEAVFPGQAPHGGGDPHGVHRQSGYVTSILSRLASPPGPIWTWATPLFGAGRHDHTTRVSRSESGAALAARGPGGPGTTTRLIRGPQAPSQASLSACPDRRNSPTFPQFRGPPDDRGRCRLSTLREVIQSQ
jgi:hypothetical protein